MIEGAGERKGPCVEAGKSSDRDPRDEKESEEERYRDDGTRERRNQERATLERSFLMQLCVFDRSSPR